MKIISALKEYEVVFINDSKDLAPLLESNDFFYIIDANVFELHRPLFNKINEKNLYVLQAEEQRKNINSVITIIDKLLLAGMKRSSTLVSIGGGITQDITGLASSIYFRGVNWIYLPTTLLAQSDSCIGGKTSLNHHNYKNILGSFFPPNKIYIYADFLRTLEAKDYLSGIGEISKLFLIKGNEGFKEIKNDIVKLIDRDAHIICDKTIKALEIKKNYIEEDEFDMGSRNILNYGHTLGHTIESISNYEISHGQAIVLGMDIANIISCNRGILDSETRSEIQNTIFDLIIKSDLSTVLLDIKKVVSLLKKDKKRVNDNYSFILMDRDFIFKKYNDILEEEIEKAIHEHLTKTI